MTHKNISLTDNPISITDGQFNNFQTFLSVAKHLSFSKAANKLHITPSAVSHRISNLEEYLGFSLFHRYTRKIQITSEGERLFEVLDETLHRITTEIQDIKSHELSGSLNIIVHPSIAHEWLIPRIAEFIEKNPLIQLNINTSNNFANFKEQPSDLGIYYADGYFPGLNNEILMSESIFPVCSIQYAEKHNLINNPENLKNCTLLHDTRAWSKAAFDSEWQLWSKKNNLNLLPHERAVLLNAARSAICAAKSHAGVAMGRYHLVKHHLENRTLIAPFTNIPYLETPFDYYLVWPRIQKQTLRLKNFLNWIKEKARQDDNTNLVD